MLRSHQISRDQLGAVDDLLKRSKNNANDAAAICEAVTRPSMRFVATKSEEQQSGLRALCHDF
jgi:transposase